MPNKYESVHLEFISCQYFYNPQRQCSVSTPPPPRRPRSLYLVYAQAGQGTPSQTLPIRVYSKSLRFEVINPSPASGCCVCVSHLVGGTMYKVIARMNQPGQGAKIASESTVLHYSHHGRNYEKRALMHHSSCLCSFSRPRPNPAHESAPSPCFKGRCAVNPSMPCSMFAQFP